MKIMKVVYSAECQNSELSIASGMYEEYNYLGEESWSVGENFNGEFVRRGWRRGEGGGVVGEISIWVKAGDSLVCAMTIPPHAVQRIYYGE